jgi:hypothetical protein
MVDTPITDSEEESEPIAEDAVPEEPIEAPAFAPPPPDLMYEPETQLEPEPLVAPEPAPHVDPLPETFEDRLPEEPEVPGSPIDAPSDAPEDEPPPPEVQEDTPEEESQAAAGGPIPTMTLARLAVEQGDFELAESTARGVLERDPGSGEAHQMLDWLASKLSAATRSDATAEGDKRSQALRRWLEAVRLAAEKLES